MIIQYSLLKHVIYRTNIEPDIGVLVSSIFYQCFADLTDIKIKMFYH